ncbi:sigma factor-like helix-turn-helix DNA-binding protein [Cohnella sp. GCM10020058]|uniref:sigma factor-like helix-turn-helix DNA-binding protein n=1 Tax=Cohnella sp. GCM10020058 TaxID=3317330 RepID=UPI0036446C27
MTTWVEERIKEYNEGRRMLEKYRASLLHPKHQTDRQREELTIIDGMISDMRYAVEWMRSGRRPGGRRGVDAKDAYKRSVLLNMDLFPSLDLNYDEIELTDEQKKAIVRVLLRMTERERECYLLHMAHGMSFAQIGAQLRLSRSTVQHNIMRAKAKIPEALQQQVI